MWTIFKHALRTLPHCRSLSSGGHSSYTTASERVTCSTWARSTCRAGTCPPRAHSYLWTTMTGRATAMCQTRRCPACLSQPRMEPSTRYGAYLPYNGDVEVATHSKVCLRQQAWSEGYEPGEDELQDLHLYNHSPLAAILKTERCTAYMLTLFGLSLTIATISLTVASKP